MIFECYVTPKPGAAELHCYIQATTLETALAGVRKTYGDAAVIKTLSSANGITLLVFA